MERFRFTLEQLLRLRLEREQECEIALAKIVGELKSVDRQINSMREKMADAFNWSMQTKDDFLIRDRVVLKSRNDLEMLQATREEIEARYKDANSKYIEAHIERDALARIKKKKHERWRKSYNQAQTRHLDEIAKNVKRPLSMTGGK